jgi:hypothetical protein
VVTPLAHRAGFRGQLVDADGALWTCAEVAHALASGGEAVAHLERSIAATPWKGVFWECRPMHGSTAGTVAFEWVVLHSPAVARLVPDPGPFRDRLVGVRDVATFCNLGGDATLVAPTPGEDGEGGAHLVAFLRTAGARRRLAFWAAVGAALVDWFADKPQETLWLSTSGLGVAWLHVRLDSQPKYITWRPYRAS